jgi:hypothetical protein
MASVGDTGAFPHPWRAEILAQPPLIAPARQFTFPQQIAGEEDALARGALLLLVHPAAGPQSGDGPFLATCALGFTDPAMPTGVVACPNPRELCAVAGGYAYIIDTTAPERSTHIPLKPVTQVLPFAAQSLLIFCGFHSLMAWGAEGLAWQTARLSWEGIRITGTDGDTLRGFGWNLMTDREVEFFVNLQDGTHTGGGFQP